MLASLRQRNFALLWLGGLLSDIGNMALSIALPFHVYTLTDSALATGITFMVQVLPSLLLGPVAGVLADRWDRKRTLVAVEALRTGLMLLLLFVHTADDMGIVYFVVFAEALIGMFYDPAKQALLPNVVNQEHVLPANALNAMSSQFTSLAAPLLGAGLVAFLGFHAVVLLDSLSFLLGAMCIAAIHRSSAFSHHAERIEETRSTTALIAVWRDVMIGLRIVWRERWVAGLFAVMSVIMLAQGMINVLVVPFINDVLRGGAEELGYLVTAQGIGGLLGSVLIGRFGGRVPSVWLIAFSTWSVGLGWFIIAHTAHLAIALVVGGLSGVVGGGVFITIPTLLQYGIPDQYRGRIFGTLGMLQSLLLLVGMACASVLIDYVGVTLLFDIVGALTLLAGVIAVLHAAALKPLDQSARPRPIPNGI